MSSDWELVTLEDVTTLLGDGLHGTPNYDDSGEYYFINGRNLNEGKIILDDKTKTASKDEYLKHKKNLNDRTILVSINGTLGNIAFYNNEKVFLGKSACYFNINDEIEKEFIYYVLKNNVFQNHIEREATGSTIKNVSLKTMREFSFRLPSLDIQNEIASILGSLDQKIHLNQQTNETLEAMEQAIFKSWFVDFDPVHAKMEAASAGRDPNRAAMAAISGISMEQPTFAEATVDRDWGEIEAALDQKLSRMNGEQRQQLSRTAELFPDELVESEIGEVPKGWGVKSLDKIADYLNGRAMQKYPPEDGKPTLPVLKIAQLRKGDTNGADIATADIPERFKVYDGDMIFSWSGSLLIKLWAGGDAALNQHLFKVTSEEYDQWFYYHWTKHHLDNFIRIAEAKAVTMGHIKRSHLKEAKCAIPCDDLLKISGQYIEPLLQQLVKLKLESNQLVELRDTLLPKLITGNYC